MNRLIYLATITVLSLFLFSLAYVYVEEPSVWGLGHPPPPPPHDGFDTSTTRIVVSPNTKGHLDSRPPLPPLPRPERPSPSPRPKWALGSATSGEDSASAISTLQKPSGLRVVGVIFYGRRDRSSILECYLRQNLVSSGGWLDEVVWAANTDNVDDLEWLNRVVEASNGDYKIVRMEEKGYGNVYEASFTERDAVYVKIDDDVVFIEPQAIAKAVTTLINNPHALMISANVANSPALGWWHYHTDAAQSFKPELNPYKKAIATRGNGEWKTSELPSWDGDWAQDFTKFDNFAEYFNVERPEDIPKHRWLPTRNESDHDMYTSSVAATDAEGGPHLMNWQIGAQNHYSFFANLENGELGKYYLSKDYGKGTIWHMRGNRLSINFIIMQGADVLDYMDMITGHPQGDDEHQLTVEMPRVLNRPVLVESQAIVSHFSYGPQRYLDKTDIMERYFNYANENVCPGRSLVDPMNPDESWGSSSTSSSQSQPSPASHSASTPGASRFFVRKSRDGASHLIRDTQ